MNIEAYNKVLSAALESPKIRLSEGGIGIERNIKSFVEMDLKGLEAELLWFSHYLVRMGRLRDEYNKDTKDLFKKTLLRSLRVLHSLCSIEGSDFSKTIAEMRKTSEDKNHDYSGVNILKGMHLGLVVRMGDKISRILNLLSKDKDSNRVSESLIDTASDLVNYSIYLTLISTGAWSTKEEIKGWVKELRDREEPYLAEAYTYSSPRVAVSLRF